MKKNVEQSEHYQKVENTIILHLHKAGAKGATTTECIIAAGREHEKVARAVLRREGDGPGHARRCPYSRPLRPSPRTFASCWTITERRPWQRGGNVLYMFCN